MDVCPVVCLKLVSLDRLQATPELAAAVAELGVEPDDSSAILKDEDRCIRCGLCAERCPTDAITMERFLFSQEWTPCAPKKDLFNLASSRPA